jgi:peptidoglycan/xylan/chitin deacetylase (PgdA/CDA1 family)
MRSRAPASSSSRDVKLALRIEVATRRGTREAVPRLLEALRRRGAGATFLFTLGPDRTGRALGELPRARRLECYGLRALLSGTLLPAPDLGAQCAQAMRRVRDEGFEPGIHAYDRVAWLARAARAGEAWTRAALERACERYQEIFGAPALVHGAAGWRMNRYAFRHGQRLGFSYGSDTRGIGPFVPVVDGELVACPQLPTTLPTLDEALAQSAGAHAAVERLLEASGARAPCGHVFTARAECEGGPFLELFTELLDGWRSLGFRIVSLRDYAAALDLARLPHHVVVTGAPGGAALQGKAFPGGPGASAGGARVR